ncbi:uncharacterized protein LOC119682200 [Teleopsis dalmanni]|uniref:uncharacterized protein LOC119682200 n=1 Tax=Teleopsis dalmanni TaxID=139649 RepID=UPI0018CE0E60|nr:uncharacterized protein LOC119682200 [Teleopsis dalmanni]
MKKLDNAKLIELVRNHSELYDTRNDLYRDTEHKDALWKEFGAKLNEKEKMCKKVWMGLRDTYRRSLKRKATAVEGENNFKWKWEDKMTFLEPYMGITKKSFPSNIKCEYKISEEFQDNDTQKQSLFEYNENEIDPLSDTNPGSRTSTPNMIDSNKSEKTSVDLKNSSAETRIDGNAKKNDNSSDIDSFFTYMSTAVKKLSTLNQHRAKGKIFALVAELEFEELTGRSINESN